MIIEDMPEAEYHARPEPWGDWEQYCENPDAPTSTVYGYVPVTLVRALVAAHGGES